MSTGMYFEAGFYVGLGVLTAYYLVNFAAGVIAAVCGKVLGWLAK
nr:MAG TPA: hypothetical protein [Caudoviricetes sp.]